MEERFSRTEALLGSDAMEKLKKAKVAIFGIGGVGGYVLEALARTGIGTIDIIDPDKVSVSNINRQIVANDKTVGEYKVDAARTRALSINPELQITGYKLFFSEECEADFDFGSYDLIIDAIDTVSSKIALIMKAEREGAKIISSMGTGNKLDPTRLEIADIYKTSVCPLARVMRTELRRRGIKHLKVLYSKEEPIKRIVEGDSPSTRHSPASIAFVPAAAGLIIAAEAVKEILGTV